MVRSLMWRFSEAMKALLCNEHGFIAERWICISLILEKNTNPCLMLT